MDLSTKDLNKEVLRIRDGSMYGYLPLFDYVLTSGNSQLVGFLTESSITVLYALEKREMVYLETDETGRLKSFTYTDTLGGSDFPESSDSALWFDGLEKANHSIIRPDMLAFTLGASLVPWLQLRQSVTDFYVFNSGWWWAYLEQLRPDLFGRSPSPLSYDQRLGLTYFWEPAYYLDREAVTNLTGGYFTNGKLASYFGLEPLGANELGAKDRNVVTYMPRSRQSLVYNYYERGISVFGLWKIGGVQASVLRELLGPHGFSLIPQTRDRPAFYVLENQAVPMVTYKPTMAIFNYYLDGDLAKMLDVDVNLRMDLLGLKPQMVRCQLLKTKDGKYVLEFRPFFCIVATHQPWFFSSLMFEHIASLLDFYSWYMYVFLPDDDRCAGRRKFLVDLFADWGANVGFEKIVICILHFLLWMCRNSSNQQLSFLVFDNLNTTAEAFFSWLNTFDLELGGKISFSKELLGRFMDCVCTISNWMATDVPNLVRYYLPNPNWCAVSVGWHENRSSFALASLANQEPIVYHLHPSINLLEDLFRHRLRTYFYGSDREGGEPRDDLRPALNYDAIYNREFDLTHFNDSMQKTITSGSVVVEHIPILPNSLYNVSKFLGFRNVYMGACLAQSLTAINRWWDSVIFLCNLNSMSAMNKQNSIYFEWYRDKGKALMEDYCYESPFVVFNGSMPALLGKPKKKIREFEEEFDMADQNLTIVLTKRKGAPMAVLFYLDGEPIPLPRGSKFYDQIKAKDWAKDGPEPIFFTNELALVEEYYLEVPNNMTVHQVKSTNDTLWLRNPCLAFSCQGGFWYLLNQCEFLALGLGWDMAEVERGKDFPFTLVNCDWILQRFQEALLAQVQFDVAGQFRLRMRKPISYLAGEPYSARLVFSNLPIDGRPSLLTEFGRDPKPLAVLVVVLERLAYNFKWEAAFGIGVAEQFLKFQRENKVSLTDSFGSLAFNFECAPLGFPLTLEEIGYGESNYDKRKEFLPDFDVGQSLFFDHLFRRGSNNTVEWRGGQIYPYNLVSRLPGSEQLNLLVPYAEVVQDDLDRFVLFMRRIGGLFYGPDFEEWCRRMAIEKLVKEKGAENTTVPAPP